MVDLVCTQGNNQEWLSRRLLDGPSGSLLTHPVLAHLCVWRSPLSVAEMEGSAQNPFGDQQCDKNLQLPLPNTPPASPGCRTPGSPSARPSCISTVKVGSITGEYLFTACPGTCKKVPLILCRIGQYLHRK